jgi:hypothetical protein
LEPPIAVAISGGISADPRSGIPETGYFSENHSKPTSLWCSLRFRRAFERTSSGVRDHDAGRFDLLAPHPHSITVRRGQTIAHKVEQFARKSRTEQWVGAATWRVG